ncbi:MAG: hypothetical protein IID40_08010, partial [Planctomycetes bacterium]|nr:hypothetical protein [Planctomycetota bacterium]
MNSLGVTTRWVRRLRSLMVLLVATCALAGLAFIWRAAWRGEVLEAALGAAGTLAVLAAAALWAAVLRLAPTVLRTQRRMARLEHRLGLLTDLHAEQGDHLTELTHRLSASEHDSERLRSQMIEQVNAIQAGLGNRFEALRVRLETFTKLHDGQTERLDQRMTALEKAWQQGAGRPDAARLDEVMAADWASPDEPPGQRTVAAYRQLVEPGSSADTAVGQSVATAEATSDKRRLRSEFAHLIHRQDYRGALATGDEIDRRFPNSTAAAD